MTWKRWRHCWQLYDGAKKVGTVACVKHHRDDGSMFYVYLKGKIISPDDYDGFRRFKFGACEHEDEVRWITFCAGEGAWSSLNRAKRVLEMEYSDMALSSNG